MRCRYTEFDVVAVKKQHFSVVKTFPRVLCVVGFEFLLYFIFSNI